MPDFLPEIPQNVPNNAENSGQYEPAASQSDVECACSKWKILKLPKMPKIPEKVPNVPGTHRHSGIA